MLAIKEINYHSNTKYCQQKQCQSINKIYGGGKISVFCVISLLLAMVRDFSVESTYITHAEHAVKVI